MTGTKPKPRPPTVSAPPPDKRAILRHARDERSRTLELLRATPRGAFDFPTALPGWRIREVVAHLITSDRGAVNGGLLPMAVGAGTDRLERWNDRRVARVADRPVPQLLAGLETWGRRFALAMTAIPAAGYRARVSTPWGGVAGLAFWARAFDEWIHRNDIRRALGLPDEDEPDPAGFAAELVLRAAGHTVTPLMGERPARVVVEVTGGELQAWTFDLAARWCGPGSGRDPDARVGVPAPVFLMASSGRDRFEDLRSSGALTIEGDEELAMDLLSRIRVV